MPVLALVAAPRLGRSAEARYGNSYPLSPLARYEQEEGLREK
jgi:hypothetical protein